MSHLGTGKAGDENTLPITEEIERILVGGNSGERNLDSVFLGGAHCTPHSERRKPSTPMEGWVKRNETRSQPPTKISNIHYVFSTLYGKQYRRQSLWKIWSCANRKANEKYGVKIVSLKNGTRHSKASQLLNRGESLEIIARLLGNSQKVVERSYGRITTDKVARIISGGENGS